MTQRGAFAFTYPPGRLCASRLQYMCHNLYGITVYFHGDFYMCFWRVEHAQIFALDVILYDTILNEDAFPIDEPVLRVRVENILLAVAQKIHDPVNVCGLDVWEGVGYLC